MGIKNTMLGIAVSTAILAGTGKCTSNDNIAKTLENPKKIELNEAQDSTKIESIATQDFIKTDSVAKDVFICLDTDENSYTHTKAVESITDPENTILEYPIDQLFQKYGKNKQQAHPLAVSGVARKYRSLVGRGGMEASDISQKLNPHQNDITSETNYEVGDTLCFRPIDSRLVGVFPTYLEDQLKEDGFETFYDKDSLLVNSPKEEDKQRKRNPDNISYWDDGNEDIGEELNNPYIYDIVVKSLPGGKSALALYRNGKLFMATYVSVGTSGRKSVTGQFEIISANPYKRSIKYENSPMPLALQIVGGYYFHQGNVTGGPLSHGCIRMPGVYVDLMYSAIRYMVKNEEYPNIDVYIDKNLYKTK